MPCNVRQHHVARSKRKTKATAIDKWVYFAVVFGPLMTLPQVYDIWYAGKTEASAITWGAYTIIAVIWLLYGIKHKTKPIIAVQSIWILLDLAIVIGILT